MESCFAFKCSSRGSSLSLPVVCRVSSSPVVRFWAFTSGHESFIHGLELEDFPLETCTGWVRNSIVNMRSARAWARARAVHCRTGWAQTGDFFFFLLRGFFFTAFTVQKQKNMALTKTLLVVCKFF